ncbi:GNAT family N-acetyltransferase [Nocardia sp. NBC_01388]|uniref:GNAT family N-acetyltransferase n=1 Tax=Nocardia sp. NBC_01388 TaxID=2903596 RepID=UPI00324F29F5
MPASPFTFRPATARDHPFLEQMLLEAAAASGDILTPDTLASQEHTFRYVAEWGRATDVGVIAVDELGVHAGAAWARLFDRAMGSPAFLGEQIPEITIAVAPDFRRRQLGTALLTELADAARAAGFLALSLGVETDNTAAQQLYRRDGWALHHTAGDYTILSKDLRTPHSG